MHTSPVLPGRREASSGALFSASGPFRAQQAAGLESVAQRLWIGHGPKALGKAGPLPDLRMGGTRIREVHIPFEVGARKWKSFLQSY